MVTVVTAAGCGKDGPFTNTISSIATPERGRRACSKEINSRYLSSNLLPSSKSISSCISTMSSSSSSSSSSSPTPRRFPSPAHNPLPKTPSALPQRRSQSVDRTRPSSARIVSDAEPVTASKAALRTTTRSLSVSFQGESFFFQTCKSKPTPRKPTLNGRKPIGAFAGVENSQPTELQVRRYPTERAKESNYVTRSLDCAVDRDNPLLVKVRLLLDEGNFNIGDRSQSLDSDSFSWGSNAKVPAKPRGICVPARFRQENGCPRPPVETPQKQVTGKQQPLANTQLQSPKFVPSPLYGPKSSSPRQDGVSRTRRKIMESDSNGQAANAPSIISFASVVGRTTKGERRIEDAHMLRLFYNQYLQWRYINARAEDTFSAQLMKAKINLYDAWITISELQESAMNKKIKLQVLMQNLKLASMLKGQIAFLDEWSTLENDHESSLRGAIEALKAITLRLPIFGDAKVDIQELKDAVNSTVGVMQAMTSSICSLLSKVEGMGSRASELAKTAAYERVLLDQCRDLLSIVAALHVKQCSLQGCILQLGRKTSIMQLQ